MPAKKKAAPSRKRVERRRPVLRRPRAAAGATGDGGHPTPVRTEAGELRILYQMAHAIGRSLQLEDLLRDALGSLESLLSIPFASVFLARDLGEKPRFELAASRGFSAAFEPQRLEYEPNQDWMRGTILVGRTHVAREPLAAPPSAVSQRGKREGIQSWVALPLPSRGRMVGLLIAASQDLHGFGDNLVRLLETLAPDLGVAIENAQLFELVQRGRNEWRATFDAVSDRIATFDHELRVLRVNRALIDSVGKPPAAIIGQSCVELFPEICAAGCPHREALAGRSVEREHSSGGRTYRIVVYPGEAGQVVHLAEDVTEERRRADQLLRAEKMSAAATVLAGVAHELNNPLTVVIAYSDLLSQHEETSPFREEVQQILRSALRCQSIVRSLLAFSRSDAPERTEVDINQLVRETLPLFSYQFRIAGIRVEERLNPTLPSLAGDRARLQQVLVNVINNAYQAVSTARKNGWLKIQTRARDGNVEVEIEDDGPGIPPEVLGRVFEPFYTTKPVGQGTGLGLALSQQMVRDHGGDIRISSDGRTGTRVVVALPITPVRTTAIEAPAPARDSLLGRRILVVDDEPDLRRLVGTALETYGAEVVLAAGGVEALAILEQDKAFDLIFSDLRMPDLGGDEMVAALRERRSALADRVLLTTGDVAAPVADGAIHQSGCPCIPKPFTIKDLVTAIHKLLG